MNSKLKKVSSVFAVLFTAYSLASCSNQVNQTLPIDSNVNISSKSNSPEDTLKQFVNAYSQVNDFVGTVTIMDSKTGNPNDANTGESKLSFKKDRNERVETTKSDDSQKVGSLLAYKGGDKVQVLLAKAIPILGKKFTLSVTDKKIATSRGLPFNQLDITAMINRFTKSGVQLSLLSSKNENGRNIVRLLGKGTFKGIDNEVTDEVLSLDSETMLPVQDEAMVNGKTVLKISVSDLKLNVGLSDDLFVLF